MHEMSSTKYKELRNDDLWFCHALCHCCIKISAVLYCMLFGQMPCGLLNGHYYQAGFCHYLATDEDYYTCFQVINQSVRQLINIKILVQLLSSFPSCIIQYNAGWLWLHEHS